MPPAGWPIGRYDSRNQEGLTFGPVALPLLLTPRGRRDSLCPECQILQLWGRRGRDPDWLDFEPTPPPSLSRCKYLCRSIASTSSGKRAFSRFPQMRSAASQSTIKASFTAFAMISACRRLFRRTYRPGGQKSNRVFAMIPGHLRELIQNQLFAFRICCSIPQAYGYGQLPACNQLDPSPHLPPTCTHVGQHFR